jgi:hypothetical protein
VAPPDPVPELVVPLLLPVVDPDPVLAPAPPAPELPAVSRPDPEVPHASEPTARTGSNDVREFRMASPSGKRW